MRTTYCISCVISAVLIILALIAWPFGDYSLLRLVVWGTAALGIVVFLKYNISPNSGFWAMFLLVMALLFSPVLPVLTEGPFLIIYAAIAVMFLLTAWKAMPEKWRAYRF